MSPDIARAAGAEILRIDFERFCDRVSIALEGVGTLHLDAEGGCCSSSWFEAFDDHEKAVGAKVLRLDARPEPRPGGAPESEVPPGQLEDYVQVYGFDLVTDRGSYYLELRNNSNGYYGGYVCARIVP